eukprot:TRINITY_DN53551_c0_g1_i1.p1 TRINITY_DN53551_c0_g1~~TRINITY_DN53551_c0_g1_i1.p1  ORF type:complete len:147 (+),score=20.59 TRINITY_DN53551_c0_g1_i1:125-565(+)
MCIRDRSGVSPSWARWPGGRWSHPGAQDTPSSPWQILRSEPWSSRGGSRLRSSAAAPCTTSGGCSEASIHRGNSMVRIAGFAMGTMECPALQDATTARPANAPSSERHRTCLLYTSDAADEEDSGDLGGRRIFNKQNSTRHDSTEH